MSSCPPPPGRRLRNSSWRNGTRSTPRATITRSSSACLPSSASAPTTATTQWATQWASSDEACLNSEYGLSYVGALAWTACYSSFWTGRIDECDIMVDSSRPWSLGPDDDEWFQSTVVHEAGHVRGLSHYNGFLSVMNSGVNKKLRAETLYMDDKEAVRAHSSYVNEYDMAIYPKWHNGSAPQWMSSPSPTTLREGSVIQWNNITVENRGTLPFGSLGVGFYMSTNSIISTCDTFLNSGSWPSFGRYTFSTFNWSATVPTVSDCGTRYFGGIIDYPNAWGERFEGNNSTAFHDGGPDPQPYTILLARDFPEPNDSFAGARNVTLPLNASLSIDQDMENDYYGFTTSGFLSNINATITFTHASGDVDMQLLNSAGTVIASSTGVTNSESIFAVGRGGNVLPAGLRLRQRKLQPLHHQRDGDPARHLPDAGPVRVECAPGRTGSRRADRRDRTDHRDPPARHHVDGVTARGRR